MPTRVGYSGWSGISETTGGGKKLTIVAIFGNSREVPLILGDACSGRVSREGERHHSVGRRVRG